MPEPATYFLSKSHLLSTDGSSNPEVVAEDIRRDNIHAGTALDAATEEEHWQQAAALPANLPAARSTLHSDGNP